MEKHLVEKHPDLSLEDPDNRKAETNFHFRIHKRYKSVMDRQLGEAICIARNSGMDSDGIIHNTYEFSRCLIPEI